ncbi:spore germination protein [Bacillus sp. B15-48]|uniref:spore germination protein n=1 Tax=Bacillus sp. B15-48 TaxID=1548601 RepID=UPI00193EEF99|nr:spore germination protein [Bacillus sp. B15-48]MBM4765214.1 hypothetical protein [Bacillus sp. B15-48]
MKDRGPITFIGKLKINNISHSGSINFGPSIHFGHQANSKINNGEIIIGDEFAFGCPEEEEENNNENENNNNELNEIHKKNFKRKMAKRKKEKRKQKDKE